MNSLVPDSLPLELRQEAKDRELVPGQVLFHYQDTARYIFALKEGRIRMVRYTCEGNLVIFQIVRAGESFAESALFTETYQCNAVGLFLDPQNLQVRILLLVLVQAQTIRSLALIHSTLLVLQ